jgi:hypothetical protein
MQKLFFLITRSWNITKSQNLNFFNFLSFSSIFCKTRKAIQGGGRNFLKILPVAHGVGGALRVKSKNLKKK